VDRKRERACCSIGKAGRFDLWVLRAPFRCQCCVDRKRERACCSTGRRDALTFACLEHLSAAVVELQLLIDDRGPARVLEVSSLIANTEDL
jgi:hypothetical protein